jgi:3'-phosphoadenosine 5'-phosphosulfate sulfotransferase (PAPS reductase)/FAD synthetase
MKKNLLVCRSGGRTSEFMYKYILENHADEYNIVGIFANTGWEHHKTIEFVHNNDVENERLFGVKPVWVEAVVHEGRVSSTHKLVNYENASRNMEPFEEVVKKYGLPNAAYPHCTRELKEQPIHDYIKNVMGWSNNLKGREFKSELDTYCDCGNCFKVVEYREYFTALGIRSDEPRRIKYNKTPQNKVYPLVDWHPGKPDKLDILDWWEDRDFDLGIPEHLGNCVGCFRKSERKAMKAYRDAPGQFANTLEKDYGHVGSNKIKGVHVDEPRTMYRNYKTSDDIIAMFKEADPMWLSKDDPEHMNEGCASSCEPFAG